MSEEKFTQRVLEQAFLLVLFPFSLFVLGSLGFLVGLSLTKWYAVLGLLLTFGFLKFRTNNWREFGVKASIFIVLQLGFMLVGALHTDDSCDGRNYHKPAAILMADGWNPVWNPEVEEFYKKNDYSLDCTHTSHLAYFPKGQWIVCAILYLVTGNFDQGDYVNYSLVFALLIVAYTTLREWLGTEKWLAILAGVVLALNPIATACLTCGHIDGLLGNLFLIFLFSSACFLKNGSKRWIPWILISAIYGCSLKHTAPVYFGLAGLVLTLPLIWRAVRHSVNVEGIGLKSWLKVMIPIPLTVAVLCVNPYITNTLNHTSPFYPLHAFDSVNHPVEDVLHDWYLNPDFHDASWLQRFVWSFGVGQEEGPNMGKTNFQISKIGTLNLRNTLCAFNASGWIFGLMLLFSVFLCFFLYKSWLEIWVLLALAATVWIQPHAWWMRFVPQIWAFPPLVFLIVLTNWRNFDFGYKRLKIVTTIFLTVLLLQGLGCFAFVNGRMLLYLQMEQRIASLAKEKAPTAFSEFCSFEEDHPGEVRTYDYFDFFSSRLIHDWNFPQCDVLCTHQQWEPLPGKPFAYHEGALLVSTKEPIGNYVYNEIRLEKEDVSMKKVFPAVGWKLKLRVRQMAKVNGFL